MGSDSSLRATSDSVEVLPEPLVGTHSPADFSKTHRLLHVESPTARATDRHLYLQAAPIQSCTESRRSEIHGTILLLKYQQKIIGFVNQVDALLPEYFANVFGDIPSISVETPVKAFCERSQRFSVIYISRGQCDIQESPGVIDHSVKFESTEPPDRCFRATRFFGNQDTMR